MEYLNTFIKAIYLQRKKEEVIVSLFLDAIFISRIHKYWVFTKKKEKKKKYCVVNIT